MMASAATETYLLGDIGGTNARFALANASGVQHLEVLSCPEYESLVPALEAYFQKVGQPVPKYACICVACPVTGDQIKLTNLHWNFSIRSAQKHFQFEIFKVFNDFTALALSLPFLEQSDRQVLGPEIEAKPHTPIVVVGPGTGLGVSALIPAPNGEWIPIAGEGGHVSFAPSNEIEDKVLLIMRRKVGGRISAERILSGMGMEDLHECLIEMGEIQSETLRAHEITSKALAGEFGPCKTVNLFCEILGSLAGDLALTFGAHGGVYIGGGIMPRILNFATSGGFRNRFEDKGRMAGLVQSIPSWVITNQTPALIGMRYWLDRQI